MFVNLLSKDKKKISKFLLLMRDRKSKKNKSKMQIKRKIKN